jgi:hypothetical protein
MSFRRSFAILASLFVVLLCLFIVGIVVSPRGVSLRAEQAALFPGIKAALVARATVTDAAGSITLSRAGSWVIESQGRTLPAAQEAVDALVKDVLGLQRGSLVTRNAAAAATLGLGERPEKTVVLADASGRTLCELRVGKPSASGQGVYVQAAKAADVWRTGQSLAASLTSARAHWADLRVLPADVKADAVMSIALARRTGSSWTATRERDAGGKTSWVLAGKPSVKLDQDKTATAASAAATMAGADFLTDGVAPTPSTASAWLTVGLSDNRSFTILFGERTPDGRYPCAMEKGSSAYLVPEWRVKQAMPSLAELTSGGH